MIIHHGPYFADCQGSPGQPRAAQGSQAQPSAANQPDSRSCSLWYQIPELLQLLEKGEGPGQRSNISAQTLSQIKNTSATNPRVQALASLSWPNVLPSRRKRVRPHWRCRSAPDSSTTTRHRFISLALRANIRLQRLLIRY